MCSSDLIWIFVGAIVIVFAMTLVSQLRDKRAAAKYRADYGRSLQPQQEVVDHLREIKEVVYRLENVERSTENAGRSADGLSSRGDR